MDQYARTLIDSLEECRKISAQYCPDLYFLSMLMPVEKRESLWPLFAFHHEIAKTREVVSETQLGLIRLQWWREELQKAYAGKEVSGHDVLVSLLMPIAEFNLSQQRFDDLLYAREFDLEDVLPSDLAGLKNYTCFTMGPLFQLVTQVCGEQEDTETDIEQVASHFALMGLMRAVSFHGAQGRCYLPQNLLVQYGVDVHDLYQGRFDGVEQVVSACLRDVDFSGRFKGKFLNNAQALSRLYWRHFMSLNCDVAHPKFMLDPPFKALKIWAGSVFC